MLGKDGQFLKVFCKKGAYFIYFILVGSLSVGWEQKPDTNQLFLLAQSTNNQVQTVCIMNENKRLFEQGVEESAEEDRQINEQNSETLRRQVKEVVKEDTFSTVKGDSVEKTKEVFHASDNSREILERIVEAGEEDWLLM